MNAEQSENFRQQRVKLAELIKTEAHLHKVCLVCSSISKQTANVCPVCHAYQWDVTPAAVCAMVDIAALTVFPSTLGRAPTFDRNYRSPFD